MNYFPFHIGDWMSHTSHLSPEEKAAYLAMMIEEYLHEKPLPLEVEQIARKINMRTHCDGIAVVLQEFYERITDGEEGWSNKRVREEIIAYKEKSEKARNSANVRWNKGKTGHNANALQTQSERNANHKPITNNQSNTPKPKIERPEDVEVQVWNDFLKHRKRLRADVTKTALNGIIREAKKAHLPLNDVLTEIVSRGWRGFKAEWLENNKTNNDPSEWAI